MGNKVLILNLVLSGLAFGMQYLDATWTTKGIAKGGFEGNELITKFYKTNRPSFRQLLAFNAGFYLVMFIPLELVAVLKHNVVADAFATACGVGFAITHFLGFREWVKWLKS
jgi:hypothetical protein